MDWIVTFVIIACAGGLTVFSAWKTGQPRKDSLKARWVSWQAVMFIAAVITVFAVIHVMSLLGYHTGGRTLAAYGR